MTRREWCACLAKLVSPSFPIEAQQALVDMLPAMAHLPNDLFTERTLSVVACAKRRQSVPAFDEITNALHEYRRTFLPDPTLRLAYRPNADLPQERTPPTGDEINYVADKLARHWREQAEDRIAMEAARPAGSESKPLRDVTAKGDALREMRAARGIKLPEPEPVSAEDVYGEFAPA